MQMQFAAKKIGDGYEAALIVDGRFMRAGKGTSVEMLFGAMVGTILAAATQDEGTEVAFTILITPASEQK